MRTHPGADPALTGGPDEPITALERALLCGAAHDRVLAVPGFGQVRDDPRFVALLGR